MESNKASKIRRKSYLLGVNNEKRKRYQTEEYAKRCTKPVVKVRKSQSREIKDISKGKSVSCQESGLN